MRRLAFLTAAVFACGCRPWCAMPRALWTPSAYGSEAAKVAETDAFIAEQVRLGRARPSAELDAAARALGADDAAELSALSRASCLGSSELERFARARSLRPSTASAYLADRFGVAPCRER